MKIRNILLIILVIITTGLYASKEQIANDTLFPNAKKRYTHILVANGIYALNTQGVGIKYSGILQIKKNPRVGIGTSVFLERIQFGKEVKLPNNVIEAYIGFFTPGISGYYRFNKLFIGQIGLSVLVGQETKKTFYYKNTNNNPFGPPNYVAEIKTTQDMVTGLHFDQTILFATQQKTGLVLGIGIFERMIDASFYTEDFGGKIYLGFHF
jgi:hypothetical protein